MLILNYKYDLYYEQSVFKQIEFSISLNKITTFEINAPLII